MSHLTHPHAQVAAGIAEAFVKSTQYDPNRLLTLFTDTRTPKAVLGNILTQRSDHLHVKSLISLLGSVARDSRLVLFRLIERSVEMIMLKAMRVDPAKRFQSMDDLRKSILALSKQEVRQWQNV